MRLFRRNPSPRGTPEQGPSSQPELVRRIEITVEQEWVSTRVSHPPTNSAVGPASGEGAPKASDPELLLPAPKKPD
jgi:hypothetical protein